jgi:hypothetical protein
MPLAVSLGAMFRNADNEDGGHQQGQKDVNPQGRFLPIFIKQEEVNLPDLNLRSQASGEASTPI